MLDLPRFNKASFAGHVKIIKTNIHANAVSRFCVSRQRTKRNMYARHLYSAANLIRRPSYCRSLAPLRSDDIELSNSSCFNHNSVN